MKRLFVAIPLPAELVEIYREYARSAAPVWPNARWTAPENLHLTVCFLGDVADENIAGLASALAAVAAGTRPFELRPEGVFLAPPGQGQPTMIWGGLAASPNYARLAGAVRSASANFAPAMLAAKGMTPHVTLARLNGGGPPQAETAIGGLSRPTGPFAVTAFGLMGSHLAPTGPTHVPISNFPFRASPTA